MMAAPTTPAYTILAKDEQDKGRWEQERGYRDVELLGGPKRKIEALGKERAEHGEPLL